MAMAAGDDAEEMNEINITPFTDVLLVLLIIFMLAQAAITQEAFKIELPKVLTPEEAQQTHILIAVTREGEIKIGTNTIPLENLHGYLLKQARRGKTNKVIIKADRSVHYGIVMSVMDTAKNAGLNSISLATEYQKAP